MKWLVVWIPRQQPAKTQSVVFQGEVNRYIGTWPYGEKVCGLAIIFCCIKVHACIRMMNLQYETAIALLS